MLPALLALDTSADWLSVGLVTAQGRWCANEPGGARASARLLPLVLQLMQQADTDWSDLAAIGFGAGPGAFTGLRTACSVAQGLALGADKPVLAIDSLMLVAEDARGVGSSPAAWARDRGNWWVAVDARMDEVYAAEYTWAIPPARDVARADSAPETSSDTSANAAAAVAIWQVVRSPRLYTLAALAQAWQQQPPQRVAGNASRVFADRLPLVAAACWPDTHDRAAALLRLTEAAWAQGRAMAADHALPLYLRDKVAQTTAERLQFKAALP